jgi:diguanylate cyclase (GGDEF)-like protein/PAS domain S-box-containing protein
VREFENFSRNDLIKALEHYESALHADDDDKVRLLYELPLHQVELEIQNRDLMAAQHDLEEARDRYAALYDFAPVGYLSLDAQGVIRNLNLTACRLLGAERASLLGLPFTGFLAVGERRGFYSQLQQVFTRREQARGEFLLADSDRHVVQVEFQVHVDPDGADTCLTILTDITPRKRAEEELRDERVFLQHLIDGIDDPIQVIGTDYRVLRMNEAARRIADSLGLSDTTCIRCHQITHRSDVPCEGEEHTCPLGVVKETRRPTKVVHSHVAEDGHMRRFEVAASPLLDDRGEVIAVIEVNRDITDQLALLDELAKRDLRFEYMAQHDNLTGLPNRVLFADRLSQAMHSAKRTGTKIAVLFIDLDRFKEVNDSFGHSIGDQVLVDFAERLKTLFREEDTVARMGGDEFTIILREISHRDDAGLVAQKVLDTFDRPFVIGQRRLYLGASIGISIYPDHVATVEALVRNADAAMYEAKASGRKGFRYYSEELTARAIDRVTLESALHLAFERKSFTVAYQPQCDLETGELVGIEALVRWRRSDHADGVVSAFRFISAAEDSGLIVQIDQFVMQQACTQMRRWLDQGLVQPGVILSVNVSGKLFDNEDIPQLVRRALDESGLEGDALELEITESIMMRDVAHTSEVLGQLRQQGIKVAIDDFGTGYSSLAYLRTLPITRLKIDRMFIVDAPTKDNDAAIVQTIVSLAESLRLDVMGEGVETPAQRDFLLGLGCRTAQGYLFSQPLLAEQFEVFVRRRQA